MLSANELRVGNWVNNNEENYQITSATIAQLERGDSTAIPINISEYWLSLLGFYQDEDSSFRWYKEWDGNVIITYDLDDNCVKVSDTWEFPKRRFVHELQNLYYALTMDELSVSV
jgi:hypothetical protein